MDSTIQIISLILYVISLLIAIKIYSIFHIREIQKKQLELVLDLISNFQKSDYSIMQAQYLKTSHYYVVIDYGNIFTVAEKHIKKKNQKIINQEVNYLPVHFTSEMMDLIKIMEFISNPILPNRIAKSMRAIFSNKTIYSKPKIEHNYILIDELRTNDEKERKENIYHIRSGYTYNLALNYVDFLYKIEESRNEINDWLKSIGIKDLNIEWNK